MIRKNRIFLAVILCMLAFAAVWSVWAQEAGDAVEPVGVVVEVATPVAASTTVYLPFVIGAPPPPASAIDILPFMLTNGRLYEVQHSGGSQARHQTQGDQNRFFHTKGNEVRAEWEELWATDDFIYRGTDTSPGNNEYYTLFDASGTVGSKWAPRHWAVGELYERNPLVVFYSKSTCGTVVSGSHRTWLKFVAYHETYTFQSGITLPDVIELAWLLAPDAQPTELYFYAKEYGLVGWGSNDRGFSYVSEIHAPGQRPDNSRESIACLNSQPRTWRQTETAVFPLPLEYALKVR